MPHLTEKDKLRLFRLTCGLAAIALPLLGWEQIFSSLFFLAAALRGDDHWRVDPFTLLMTGFLIAFMLHPWSFRVICAAMGIMAGIVIFFTA